MILPNVRASLGRGDAVQAMQLIGRGDADLRDAAELRLDQEGLDALLDDPRLRNALLTEREVSARPELIFYVVVRQALLEGGIDDRGLADYVTSLVLAFGSGARAFRPTDGSGREYRYLVDIVMELSESEPRQAFLLSAHLGAFSLWLAGLFPQYLEARVRRGAPTVRYYESMGETGYRLAADRQEAAELGVEEIFREVADHFSGVRLALNRVSDRVLWPGAGDPVARLIRELEQNRAQQSGPIP